MGINNRHLHRYDPMKVIIAIMISLGFILTDLFLQSVVEESKRNQARLNLEQIHHCQMTGCKFRLDNTDVFLYGS